MDYTKHAERRMRLRRIDAAEVEEAMANRESTRASTELGDRVVVIGRTSSGRRIKIVLNVDESVVVTVAVQGRKE
jgi:hypothetical protein